MAMRSHPMCSGFSMRGYGMIEEGECGGMKERGRKVLLLDDSLLTLLLEKEALTRAGFDVRRAAAAGRIMTKRVVVLD